MYTLITAQVASKFELETCYTLDDALKLYALWQMQQDIQACRYQEMKNERER